MYRTIPAKMCRIYMSEHLSVSVFNQARSIFLLLFCPAFLQLYVLDPVFGFSILNYYSNRVNVRDLFSFAVYWKPLI